eukprot:1160366-Pelagomonas_calceolata.AAC.1
MQSLQQWKAMQCIVAATRSRTFARTHAYPQISFTHATGTRVRLVFLFLLVDCPPGAQHGRPCACACLPTWEHNRVHREQSSLAAGDAGGVGAAAPAQSAGAGAGGCAGRRLQSLGAQG